MAQISFNGLCSGSVTKTSSKTGKPYTMTTFVELPSLNKFEVFGDLGLVAHSDPRPYILEGNVVSLGNVSVVPASPKKS